MYRLLYEFVFKRKICLMPKYNTHIIWGIKN